MNNDVVGVDGAHHMEYSMNAIRIGYGLLCFGLMENVNSAIASSGGSGVNMDGKTSFDQNSADLHGGAMYNFEECTVNMDGTTFYTHNSAGSYGGAVYTHKGCVVNMDGTTSFAHNTADHAGGAMHNNEECTVYMDGSTSFTHNSAHGYGGAMSNYKGCVVNMDGRTSFTHNSAVEYGGAIHAEGPLSDGCTINIEGNTLFANNFVLYDGGGIYQCYTNLTIAGNTSFVDNSASIGGGIESYGGSLIISVKGTTKFAGNNAKAGGGAIMMIAPLEVKLANVTFASNTAKSGGAISLESTNYGQRVYDNCIFKDNVATDGGAVYFFGGAGDDYVTSSVFCDNYASNGGAVYTVGTLELVSTSFVANRADKEGLAIFATRLFSSSNLTFANVSFANNAISCPIGEYGADTADENVSRFETVCQGCTTVPNQILDGVWVTNEHETPTCTELPKGTVSVSSGTTVASLTLKKGYFRTSNETSVIFECYRSEACEGGDDPAKYCANGYEGAYCSICAEGFSRGFAYSCGECSNTARGSAVALSVTVAVVGLLLSAVLLRSLGTVVGDNTVEENELSQRSTRSTCSSYRGLVIQMLPLSTIKIVLVVWQIIHQFSSIAEVVYPRHYETFLSYLGFTTFDIGVIAWYSCLFSPDFYDHLLVITITPLVVLSMLAGSYYVAKTKYRNSNHGILVLRHQHLSAAVFVIFVVYSSASSTIFQTFRCDPLDGAVSYLQADYSLTCWSAKHKVYIVYASLMLIVYPIGIPALFCWWLVRNRKALKQSDRQTMAHLKPFNSIWGPYRPSQYYFEVVEFCRRVTLSASSVFFIPNSINQIAIVLSLTLVFLFVSESMSPFERNADMRLYRWGNGVILATMFVALLIEADGSNDESGTLSVFGWVLITANVVMIAAVLVQSVLFAREWRGSMSIAEEIIPPVQRHPSWSSRSTQPVRAVMLEDDSDE